MLPGSWFPRFPFCLEAGRHFQESGALLSARAWSLPAASLAEQGAQEQQGHVLHSPGCLWTMTCHFWSHLLSSIWGLIVPMQEAGAYFSSWRISRAFGDGRQREMRDRNCKFLHQGWYLNLQKEKGRWQNKDTPFNSHLRKFLVLINLFLWDSIVSQWQFQQPHPEWAQLRPGKLLIPFWFLQVSWGRVFL